MDYSGVVCVCAHIREQLTRFLIDSAKLLSLPSGVAMDCVTLCSRESVNVLFLIPIHIH